MSRIFERWRAHGRELPPPPGQQDLWLEKHAEDIFLYEMLTLRDIQKDALMWQAPSLALAAQAFLLTIALNPQFPVYAVLISSALGFVVAGLSMQLMARHRILNVLDRAHLHYLEERLGLRHVSARSDFWSNDKYVVPDWIKQDDTTHGKRWANRGAPEKISKFADRQSYNIWVKGLAVFAILNVSIFLVELSLCIIPAVASLVSTLPPPTK